MRKFSVFALMVICAASVAVAASMGVPWFVDNAGSAVGVPQSKNGVTGMVTLKSNRTDTVVCTIQYFSQEGYFLGPPADRNTFTIAPLSALLFRPTANDPDVTVCGAPGSYRSCVGEELPNTANAGGQEGLQGVLVPNRPRSDEDDTTDLLPGSDDGSGNEVWDTKKNGSLTISWVASGPNGDKEVQGQVAYFQTTGMPGNANSKVTMSYAHLLPPGY